jgi:ABC-2 type transport system ATP-binding protein
MLSRVGLGHAVDRKVGGFSKGMTQRLGLAQALAHGPDLLLLDEPTTGLDPKGRRLIREIIEEESSKGTTVFLSSHILSDLEESCDWAAMILDGQVIFSRPMEELAVESGMWEVEVMGLDGALQSALEKEDILVKEDDGGSAVIQCTSRQKTDLLRRLIDTSVEIGTIGRSRRSLEDLFMEYVDKD